MAFSIKKSFKESWDLFFSKKVYIPFILASVALTISAYIIIGIATVSWVALLVKGSLLLLIIVGLILAFFMGYLVLVSTGLPLETHKNRMVNFKKVLSESWSVPLILKALGVVALYVLVAFVAFPLAGLSQAMFGQVSGLFGVVLTSILPILWVAYVFVRWSFSLYILFEQKGGVVASMKKSHAMMKGNGWKFLLFMIIVTVAVIAIQTIFSILTWLSPVLSTIVTVIAGVFFLPWFSLLVISPYLQIKNQ